MIIGQTHKVDLAHPVDYQPGTIYKYGSVVKSQGNLYVASAFIPAVDPGPGMSALWEQISEIPEIPTNYYSNFISYDEPDITNNQITSNTYFPARDYELNTDITKNVSLLGFSSCFDTYKPVTSNNRCHIHVHQWETNAYRVIAVNRLQCLHFVGNISNGVIIQGNSNNCIINECSFQFDNHGIDYSNSLYNKTATYINCTFYKSGSAPLFYAPFNNKGKIVLYDCVVFGGASPNGGLGENIIWINPILYGYTADTVGDTTLINPTYL